MVEIKREYVVPLRRGFFNTPRYKRTHKAVRVLKEFIIKHMKSEKIKIGKRLNDFLWKNGIKNPPARVSVTMSKDKEDVVRVELAGFDYVDFKQVESDKKPETLKEKIADKVGTKKPETKEVKEKKPAKKVTENIAEDKTEAKVEEKLEDAVEVKEPAEEVVSEEKSE